jgi:Mrp family chromosome partitioning ATPase
MFVDMPPGTGDVALTVFQSLKVDGIIVVTTPQDLVSMIVAKAVNMAKLMNVPIVGIIENMSYFVCDECDKKHFIFGESKIESVAAAFGIPVIASLPINTVTPALADKGEIFKADLTDFDEAIKSI